MRNNHRTGFTIVELLVVIGIIVLLMSMLLPVVGKLKEQDGRTHCASNLRQCGAALMHYAITYGRFPQGVRDDNTVDHAIWISSVTYKAVIDHTGGNPRVWTCPSLEVEGVLPDGQRLPLYYPDVGYHIGYFHLGGHNNTPWPCGPQDVPWKSPKRLGDGGQLVLMSDNNSQTDSFWSSGYPHTPSGWVGGNTDPAMVNKTPQQLRAEGGNVLNADGAVVWVPVAALQKHQTLTWSSTPPPTSPSEFHGWW